MSEAYLKRGWRKGRESSNRCREGGKGERGGRVLYPFHSQKKRKKKKKEMDFSLDNQKKVGGLNRGHERETKVGLRGGREAQLLSRGKGRCSRADPEDGGERTKMLRVFRNTSAIKGKKEYQTQFPEKQGKDHEFFLSSKKGERTQAKVHLGERI